MGLDPGIRQQKVKDWFGTAARLRFEALIAKDPKRALAMFGVGTPDDLAGLSPNDILRLINQARAATVAQLVEAGTRIDLASQNASEEIADTGSYSGNMPSSGDFAAVYGTEEGGKQYQDFARKIDIGRQAFGMRMMPNQAIHAALRDVEPGPGSSQEEQERYGMLEKAVSRNLAERAADPGGYVRQLFPNIASAWNDASKKKDYQSAIIRSVAAQQQLGIEDIQPLPDAIAKEAVMSFVNHGAKDNDSYAANRNLFDGISDSALRLKLVVQLIYASALMLLK